MPEKLNQLITESRNPQSEQLDRLSTVDILR
ncbi:N-acetylmuramic acid 6-phosphate etherase, partial [Pasteurellaceae bacterium Phil11]